MKKKDKVSIVLPFCGQSEYTKLCVSSILEYTDYPYTITAVDNGSREDISDWLIRKAEDISIIKNENNVGAPRAFNQGIEASDGEYILLLNNDTIVTRGWLGGMVSALREHTDSFIAGPCTNPRMELRDMFPAEEGYRSIREIQRTAAAVWAKRDGRVDYVPGLTSFCMLIRRGLIDKIGLFDEDYGLGTNDDHDFCIRATMAGCRIICVKYVFVFHFYSRTLGELNMDELDRKNRAYFISKFNEAGLKYFEDIGQPYSGKDPHER